MMASFTSIVKPIDVWLNIPNDCLVKLKITLKDQICVVIYAYNIGMHCNLKS